MLNVIYMDKDLIVVEKPPGIQSQSSRGFEKDMVSEIKKYLVANGSERNPYVSVVHRLDQPVRGIMVYGLNKRSAASLSAQMAASGHMDKEYMALVCGKPRQNQGRLVDNIYFDKTENMSYIVSGDKDSGDTKQAVLEYKTIGTAYGRELAKAAEPFSLFEKEIARLDRAGLIKEEETYSLVKIRLLTGRHHQIRVQLSNIGCPILGDTRYNEGMSEYRGSSSLCLAAVRISFIHPTTGKKESFSLVNVN